MRLSCHAARNLLTVPRPRLTSRPPFRLPSAIVHHRSFVIGFRSAYLTGRSKFGMSSALPCSFSETHPRSFASQKANTPVAKHNSVNHNHHDEHKHNLFGGHEHEHEHGPDAEKVIEALKGGGELSCVSLASLFHSVEVTLPLRR